MAKLYFPDKTLKLLAELNLNEETIYDVFNHGEYRKTDKGAETMTKKYSSYGYEIEVLYSKSKWNNDEYVITYVRKRNRR